MKKYYLKSLIIIGLFLLSYNNLFSQGNSIIISEYINSGNNKVIEIYNANDAFYELISYAFVYDTNKDSIFSSDTLYLNDTLFAGQTYVIASISSDQAIKDKANLLVDTWFANLDITDQLVLLKHGEIFDWFIHPNTVPAPTNYKAIRDSLIYWAEDTLIVESFSDLWHTSSSTDYSTLGVHQIVEDDAKSADIDDAFVYSNLIPENIEPRAAGFASSLTVQPSIPYGSIQVSYPIYTLKLKDYQLPISLNYSSNGVRVMDVSDWVGLGWNINTGGVIVRNTRGYPDEYTKTYQSKKLTKDWRSDEEYSKSITGYLYNGNSYTYDYLEAKRLNGESVKEIFRGAIYRHSDYHVYDSEPDEFSFSCGGYSGKFYFNPDGTVEVASASNITVEPVLTSHYGYDGENSYFSHYTLDSFTIITPDGVKYVYGTTNNSIEYRTDLMYNSVYNLQAKVHTTIMGNIIKECGYYYIDDCKYDYIFPTSIAKFVNVSYYEPWFEIESTERYKKKNKYPYPYKWFLSEVITPLNETITLNYQSGKEVYYVTNCGESVASMNIGTVPTGHLKKNDEHFFGFYNDWTPYLCNPFATDESSLYNDPSSLNDYAFVSPKGFSPNVSLNFSNQRVKYTPKYISSIVSSNGYSINFNVNDDPNIRIDMPGARRLEEIEINYNLNNFKTIELGYTQYSSNETAVMPTIEITGIDSKRYQFPENNDYIIDILDASRHRLFLSSITEYNENNQSFPAYEFNYFNDVKLPRRISHHRSIGGFFEAKSKVFNSELYETSNININGLTFSGIDLAETDIYGSKYNIVKGDSDPLPSASASARLMSGMLSNVKFPNGMQKDIQYNFNTMHGASVKEIKTYDSSGELKLENYSFTDAESWYDEKFYSDKFNLGYVDRNIYEIAAPEPSSSCYFLGTTRLNKKRTIGSYKYDVFQDVSYSYSIASRRFGYGSPAIYRKVQISTKDNGRTVYRFFGHFESNPSWYDQDFNKVTRVSYQTITNDNSALAGLLWSKEVFNESGQCVATDTNYFSIKSGDNICNGVTPYRLKIFDGSSSDPVKKYYGAVYWNSNKWAAISNIKSFETLDNGVTTSINKSYTYNTDLYDTDLKLLTKEEITYNDTEYDHVVTKYSGEYPSIPPSSYSRDIETKGLYYLKERNQLNSPVEKLYYKNGKIIGGYLVTYSYRSSTDNGIFAIPEKEYKLNVTEPITDDEASFTHSKIQSNDATAEFYFDKDERYELIRTYDSFDNKGNILQYHDEHNVNTSFYWDGEFKQYMTAKVVNAVNYEIYYNSFEYETSPLNLSSDSHSGKYSYKTLPMEFAVSKEILGVTSKKYKLSAWVKTESGFDLGGDHANLVIKVFEVDNPIYVDWITCWITETNGEWQLFETVVDMSNYSETARVLLLELWNSNPTKYLLADDIRFHPIDARMTTSTYDPVKGITSMSDVTGKVSNYEYDNFNRLKLIRDFEGNIVERYNYHYEGEPVDEGTLYHVTTEVVGNGTVTPPEQWIKEGESVTLNFEPEDGYYVEDVLLNGNSIGAITEDSRTVFTDYHYKAIFDNGSYIHTDLPYDNISFTLSGGTKTFTVDSNVDWEITDPGILGLTITPLSGNNSTTITVTCSSWIRERTGTIMITGGGVVKEINFEQTDNAM